MPSYLITGTSRGIGNEFLRQLSSNPDNLVIGLVRNKPAMEEQVAQEFKGRNNIHIVEAELTNYDSLKKAAEDVAKITSSLDYIIANAALITPWSAYEGASYLNSKDPVKFEKELLDCFQVNVIGNIHLFTLFLPLIQKGEAKKVITLTSGLADDELTRNLGVALGVPYSISKAGMNTAVAKFSAEHQKNGILFFGISPGLVNTGQDDGATPEQLVELGKLGEKFAAYAPHFKGHITAEYSVQQMLEVIYRADINKGYAGAFLSHYGNKQWL